MRPRALLATVPAAALSILLAFAPAPPAGAGRDGDGVPDATDNCLEIANLDQRDSDLDGFGNACDADLNNDGLVDFLDLGILKSVFFSADPHADLNGDGTVDFLDLGMMKGLFFRPPGPAGPPVPPDPSDVAPPVDSTVSTTLGSASEFLYAGEDPIQTG